ncbi:MAG: ImmA/IrrE family metallo-endopeptidase [Acholeplasmatales bacterium]|nr:ImmA/IrrE family metallo-endopeptidase [Acholeplasmatales bacterium]
MIYTGKWKCFWSTNQKEDKIESPRFELVKSKAVDLLLELGINALPVKLDRIIEEFSDFISVFKWSEAKDILKTDDPLHLKQKNISGRALRIDDGCCSRYLVVYDDVGFSSPYKGKPSIMMQRWTVGHEFGHIFSNHLLGTDMLNREENSEYGILEIEANFFAAELFMPTGVYSNIIVPDSDFISLLSRVSIDASQRREWYLTFNHYNERDDLIFKQFFNFLNDDIKLVINEEPFHRNGLYYDFTHKCKNCGYIMIGNVYKYCIKCGSDYKSGKENKKYKNKNFYNGPFIQLPRKNKMCIICLKSSVSEDDKKYACGHPSNNVCSCGRRFGSEASYCSDCGQELPMKRINDMYIQRIEEINQYKYAISKSGYLLFDEWDYIRYKLGPTGLKLNYSVAFFDDFDVLHIITSFNTFSLSLDFIRTKTLIKKELEDSKIVYENVVFNDVKL